MWFPYFQTKDLNQWSINISKKMYPRQKKMESCVHVNFKPPFRIVDACHTVFCRCRHTKSSFSVEVIMEHPHLLAETLDMISCVCCAVLHADKTFSTWGGGGGVRWLWIKLWMTIGGLWVRFIWFSDDQSLYVGGWCWDLVSLHPYCRLWNIWGGRLGDLGIGGLKLRGLAS